MIVKVLQSNENVFLFDEALEVHVRYSDNIVVKTLCVESEFHGHSKASDSRKNLMPYIDNFEFHNVLQISMDVLT